MLTDPGEHFRDNLETAVGKINLALGSFLVAFSERGLRWLGGIKALFALGMSVYTGLLPGVVKAVPFWNTPIVPPLFFVSAV
jgi:formate-dependent nitrite reductase membrane component NrfD